MRSLGDFLLSKAIQGSLRIQLYPKAPRSARGCYRFLREVPGLLPWLQANLRLPFLLISTVSLPMNRGG